MPFPGLTSNDDFLLSGSESCAWSVEDTSSLEESPLGAWPCILLSQWFSIHGFSFRLHIQAPRGGRLVCHGVPGALPNAQHTVGSQSMFSSRYIVFHRRCPAIGKNLDSRLFPISLALSQVLHLYSEFWVLGSLIISLCSSCLFVSWYLFVISSLEGAWGFPDGLLYYLFLCLSSSFSSWSRVIRAREGEAVCLLTAGLNLGFRTSWTALQASFQRQVGTTVTL